MYPVASERGSPCPFFPLSLSAIFGLVYRPRDFASYILGIFICNLLLYLAFYIIMKVKGGSRCCHGGVCLQAAVAVMGVSVSKGEGMGLFSCFSLGYCAAAEECRGAFVGLRVEQGVGAWEGFCVAISGVAEQRFPGVGSPLQTDADGPGWHVSPMHGFSPWKGLRAHCEAMSLSAAPQL